MKKVIVKNRTKNNIFLKEAEVADTFFTRLRGLLGRKSLDMDTGLVITSCNSIHMIGMKFPIDVIFLDKDKIVCHVLPNMKIMQVSPIIKNAQYAIECPVGTIKSKNIEINDKIEFLYFNS